MDYGLYKDINGLTGNGFADGLFKLLASLAKLVLQLVGRAGEIVTPRPRRPCIGRVGEMRHVRDAGLGLFGGDFAIEIACHPKELGNHRLDLRHAAAALVDLKAF